MDWQPSSNKNKSSISYLMIVLVFILLAWGVYMFFKYKITVIEKESTSAYQFNAKTNLNKEDQPGHK